MIYHSEKFVYIHIPKTGGHSVADWLEYKRQPESYKGGDIKIAYPDYFQFATVRNTWEILVSYFVFFNFQKYFTFEDMILRMLPSEKQEDYFYGKNGQLSWITHEDNICVDFICNTNFLQQHLDYLFINKKIGKDAAVLHLNKSHNSDYRKWYKNTKIIDMVYNIFKKEIDLFNFDFENKFQQKYFVSRKQNHAIKKKEFVIILKLLIAIT